MAAFQTLAPFAKRPAAQAPQVFALTIKRD
jgi:hypothetical protein